MGSQLSCVHRSYEGNDLVVSRQFKGKCSVVHVMPGYLEKLVWDKGCLYVCHPLVKQEHRFLNEGLYMIRSNGRRVNYSQSFKPDNHINQLWIIPGLPDDGGDWYQAHRMVLIIPGTTRYDISFVG